MKQQNATLRLKMSVTSRSISNLNPSRQVLKTSPNKDLSYLFHQKVQSHQRKNTRSPSFSSRITIPMTTSMCYLLTFQISLTQNLFISEDGHLQDSSSLEKTGPDGLLAEQYADASSFGVASPHALRLIGCSLVAP